MTDPPGPSVEEELRWDTAATFTINTETPWWDILRAQLLWSIWCHKVAHAFQNDQFHLGSVLWKAWRNTIYCAMEAYKELFRHKRNEEKRHEMISCFETIWTAHRIFGRASNSSIKWNITPHSEFIPRDLGAWITPPIRIHMASPSLDPKAEFATQPDFADRVEDFIHDIARNWRPPDSPATDTKNTQADHWRNRDPAEPPPSPDLHSGSHREPSLPLTTRHQGDKESAVAQPAQRNPLQEINLNSRSGPSSPQKEHAPQHTGSIHPAPTRPTSRHKIKCNFGPRRQRGLHQQENQPPHPGNDDPEEDPQELDVLLREIDRTRSAGEGPPPTTLPPKSRAKVKCHFGPLSYGQRNLSHQAPLPRVEAAFAGETSSSHDGANGSGSTSQPHHDSDPPVSPQDDPIPPLSPHRCADRVTLIPPYPLFTSPLRLLQTDCGEPPSFKPQPICISKNGNYRGGSDHAGCL